MALTSETLDQLQGEPGWLRERREAAFATYERLPSPSRTDEEWRRTDVSRLDLSKLSPLAHGYGAGLDGQGTLPNGVILQPLAVAAAEHPDLVQPRLFSLVRADRDRFGALHAAFFTGGTFLYVPDGVEIDQP
ncbi:MAG TPA: Fe-S cluster assembly protein SufD, partial [Candidatus Dormibacteraeota bacterium]|nr:Fe-S cluster assembly protein SufD [Candidatus Dormibacteraeota bacterium]